MKPVAILANGNSLLDQAESGNLDRIQCDTIGLNRSWQVHKSAYQVMVDPPQWAFYREQTGKEAPDGLPGLITGIDGPGAMKVKILSTTDHMIHWSWEPWRLGVYLCRSVTWVALQLAVSWYYNPIYILGLDLQPKKVDGKLKGKFWGGHWPENAEAEQRELFGYARGMLGHCGIDIINVVERPEDSRCWAFRRETFDESLGKVRWPVRGDGQATIPSGANVG